MADEKGYVKITDEQLSKSAVKYRKELLMMPVLAMAGTLKHMTQRPGVRGKEVVGELSGDIELGPYDEGREDTESVGIEPRELETFLGSVVKKFSPNSVWQTVYRPDIIIYDADINTFADFFLQFLEYEAPPFTLPYDEILDEDEMLRFLYLLKDIEEEFLAVRKVMTIRVTPGRETCDILYVFGDSMILRCVLRKRRIRILNKEGGVRKRLSELSCLLAGEISKFLVRHKEIQDSSEYWEDSYQEKPYHLVGGLLLSGEYYK